MTELSRRHILTGAAAAAAIVPFAAPSAHAAAPLSGRQAPSFYRSKLGDFEITVVSDGARAIPLPATSAASAFSSAASLRWSTS